MTKDHQTEKVFRIIGASNHSEEDRHEQDFYTTDPDCVKDLLEVETFNHEVLEPCCGCGNISEVLVENGYDVLSTDLFDHNYGVPGVDYKSYTNIDRDIITNPPFGVVTDFITHMLNELQPGHKMALFLKLQFLEGQSRYADIFSRGNLETVYIYSKRVTCYKDNEMYVKNKDGSFVLDKDGNKKKVPSAVCYCWYVFNKDYQGNPTIKWINK